MSDTLTQETVDLGSGTELRPDLAGLLLSIPGNPAVWLIMPEGYRALVEEPKPYTNLFIPEATITKDINANDITLGAPITHDAVLAAPAGGGTIYLITNGMKWPISAEGFSRYQFGSTGQVFTVPPVLLDFIPDGPPITWPPQ